MLHIYNSLTRKKEPFAPIAPPKVGMYVCGMTVYDYLHLGHARVLLTFDVVARYLRRRGYEVSYVRNITDIDDKIIKRAQENREDFRALTERFIAAMNEDADALGAIRPDAEPRATAHIPQILDLISQLMRRGYAYQAGNKDIYYRVRKFTGYGRLSGKGLDELQSGARVEVGESKEDPLDFVLWKAAKPGEPSWDSPWGPGRPGWHIECSAMSTACLGRHFDLHGGGMDLMFPHHENEIAQSEAATGEKFVNAWMHVGFVRINQEKMSKSRGNFFTVREVLKQFKPEVVRYFILASHYRSPLDYSEEHLRAAKAALDGFYIALRDVTPETDAETGAAEAQGRFFEAMDDDFNTARALAELSGLVRELNRAKTAGDARLAARMAATVIRLGAVLGLFQENPEAYLKTDAPSTAGVACAAAGGSKLNDADVDALVVRRTQARRNRDWAESDRIRDLLKAQGVVLEDVAGGETVWRRA